ncbi:MAG: gamma-glutamylcyclotransferase [Deltaproteobacteria bacterium]|nr:gamma-glutamylcyclotransferase [Deltaproteobacteria bacterium]
MLRMFAWRICFELLNLKKLLIEDKTQVFYFAYGANLDKEVLKDRKISPLEEKEFVAENFELQFSHPGPYEGMGFASLIKKPGAKTYGKLYRLTQTDLKRLDYYELVPFLGRYKREEVRQNGLVFYIFTSGHPAQNLKPTKSYKDSILNGLKTIQGAPDSYIRHIESIEVLETCIPAKTLNFIFNSSKCNKPMVKILFQKLDQICVRLFINHIIDRSLTERFIRVD